MRMEWALTIAFRGIPDELPSALRRPSTWAPLVSLAHLPDSTWGLDPVWHSSGSQGTHHCRSSWKWLCLKTLEWYAGAWQPVWLCRSDMDSHGCPWLSMLTEWSPLTGLGWKTWGQTCVAPREVGISRFYLEVQADESWLQNTRKYLVSLLGSKELESTSRAGVVPPCSWPCRGVHCWCFPVQQVGDISEHGASWGLLHGVERWEIMLRFIPSLIQSTDRDQSLCILQDSIQT